MDAIYLQYGCGLSAPKNWENYDTSPSLLISKIPLFGKILKNKSKIPNWPQNVRYGNIVKGLPISDNSCPGIYCSHILEHLSVIDFRKALENTYKYLAKDGIFRLVVPDLEKLANVYISSNNSNSSFNFMQKADLGVYNSSYNFEAFLRILFGNSQHLWMWDYKSLKNELEKIGFKNIRRAYYSDSKDKRFNEVESIGRWEGSLGIECKI